MNSGGSIKKNIMIEIICLLYILLFVYAASSKLLDFENFQIQLGQSPLVSAFSLYLSWFIPVLELLISVFLIIPSTRRAGLTASYFLMVMFTAYIFVILNYSSFVPCSCGGILEKMNWTQHLVFNFVFLFLALLALYLEFYRNCTGSLRYCILKYTAFLFLITILASAIVTVLFISSEKIIHHHNNQIRRFPHTPMKKGIKLDLGVSSYYIAGAEEDKIYLGNTTAPTLITVVDKSMKIVEKKRIEIETGSYRFRGLKITVRPPYFFVTDGTVPIIYRGRISDWKIEYAKKIKEYFAAAVPIDSVTLAIRSHSSVTGEGILGMADIRTGETALNPALLVKQFDGVFDLDGHLLYDNVLGEVLYVYAYRNQYTIADRKLGLIKRGNTIDTISRAQLEVVAVEKNRLRKLAKPPLFVNKSSAVCGYRLFINSAVPGKYEKDALWRSASIIDVYDLRDSSYRYSFCIYDIEGKKARSFVISGKHLYALIGSHLFRGTLNEKKMKQYEK